jgi:hypothetical protein
MRELQFHLFGERKVKLGAEILQESC